MAESRTIMTPDLWIPAIEARDARKGRTQYHRRRFVKETADSEQLQRANLSGNSFTQRKRPKVVSTLLVIFQDTQSLAVCPVACSPFPQLENFLADTLYREF